MRRFDITVTESGSQALDERAYQSDELTARAYQSDLGPARAYQSDAGPARAYPSRADAWPSTGVSPLCG